MTNFQVQASTLRSRWLTPERALFFVPVLTSFGLAVAMLALAIVPLWRLASERQRVVQDLSKKSLELPQLERDLQVQQSLKLQLEGQENRLIQMLVGAKSLDTFLAGLNLLSVKNRVGVVTTEPGKVETWVSPLEGVDNEKDEPDDLLLEGLEKRSALIKVQGTFRNVQGFLQDLESLEVFVIPSDLAMGAIRLSVPGSINEEAIETELELQLSAYGRAVPLTINDIDVTK